MSDREACRDSLRKFIETYLPGFVPIDNGPMIKLIEAAILNGEHTVTDAPRGQWGKTTSIIMAALWAALYGHSRFLLLMQSKRSPEYLMRVAAILAHQEKLSSDFHVQTERVGNYCVAVNDCLVEAVSPVHFRGLARNGRRPDLVLIDDPATPAINKSVARSQRLEREIRTAALCLGSPRDVDGSRSVGCALVGTSEGFGVIPSFVLGTYERDSRWRSASR